MAKRVQPTIYADTGAARTADEARTNDTKSAPRAPRLRRTLPGRRGREYVDGLGEWFPVLGEPEHEVHGDRTTGERRLVG